MSKDNIDANDFYVARAMAILHERWLSCHNVKEDPQ